jgi:hypothetical protein
MGLFSRRPGERPRRRLMGHAPAAPPDPVLAPLSVAEAADLVRLAERAASERGLQARYDGDGALVTDDGMVAGLTNLARAVSSQRRRHWNEIVSSHFDQLSENLQHPPDLPADLHRNLYLRLVADDGIPDEWIEAATEVMPGVLSVPSTYTDAFGSSAVSMHFDVGRLGMSREQATRVGLANLRRLRDELQYLYHDGAEVAALSGTLFTASRALVLDTVLRETLKIENPSYGVLVATPVRDLLLVHVLRDRTVVPAMDLMVTVTTQSYSEHAGPISPHVYYVADGEWQQVTQYVDGAIRIVVDGPMADAVHRLGLM